MFIIYLTGYIIKLYPVRDIAIVYLIRYNYLWAKKMKYKIKTLSQLSGVLKSRRKELKLTQKQAAERVGLLPKTISLLENSPMTASLDSLYKYISALNIEFVLEADENDNSSFTDW